jgi:hypothetical protein
VTPDAGAVTSLLTATTSTSFQPAARFNITGTWLAGAGLFGCFFASLGRSHRKLCSLLSAGLTSTLIAGFLLASTGCGGSSSQANRGSAPIVVTATSGALSHTSTVNLSLH